MQRDGNLVLYQSGVALWNSGTAGQNCGSNQCYAVFRDLRPYGRAIERFSKSSAASGERTSIDCGATPGRLKFVGVVNSKLQFNSNGAKRAADNAFALASISGSATLSTIRTVCGFGRSGALANRQGTISFSGARGEPFILHPSRFGRITCPEQAQYIRGGKPMCDSADRSVSIRR